LNGEIEMHTKLRRVITISLVLSCLTFVLILPGLAQQATSKQEVARLRSLIAQYQRKCTIVTDAQNNHPFENGYLSVQARRSKDSTNFCYTLFNGVQPIGYAVVWYNDNADHTNGTNVYWDIDPGNSVVLTLGSESKIMTGVNEYGVEHEREKFDFSFKSEGREKLPSRKY
jgi:hypothetical protein